MTDLETIILLAQASIRNRCIQQWGKTAEKDETRERRIGWFFKVLRLRIVTFCLILSWTPFLARSVSLLVNFIFPFSSFHHPFGSFILFQFNWNNESLPNEILLTSRKYFKRNKCCNEKHFTWQHIINHLR